MRLSIFSEREQKPTTDNDVRGPECRPGHLYSIFFANYGTRGVPRQFIRGTPDRSVCETRRAEHQTFIDDKFSALTIWNVNIYDGQCALGASSRERAETGPPIWSACVSRPRIPLFVGLFYKTFFFCISFAVMR